MIIDSHQHFWEYDPARHSWINDKMKILRRNYLPADLESRLQAGGVEGCVAVQAYTSESETEYLLQCAAGHFFIKGVVGWVDLCGVRVQERLEYFSKNPLLKGIRHIVQDEPDDFFMLRPDFQNGISLLSRYGLCYDILIYPRQLPAAVELVRRFPEQRFVLDHIAKPQISNGIDPQWEWHIRQLGNLPNVFCKLSGMVTETRGFRWNRKEFYPFMDIVMQAFGPDRLMFGSDWPVCLPAATYEEVMNIVTAYLRAFTPKERRAVMGLNAVRCYGL